MTVQALSDAINAAQNGLEAAQLRPDEQEVARFQDELANLRGSGRSNNYRNTKYGEFLNLAKERENLAINSEKTWSVDRQNNTIKLDNGYQLKLDERRSQLTLEKIGQGGGVERSTRIWGDPHIDVGNNGKNNADFYKDTSLLLEDGTKITIGTRSKGRTATYSDLLTITRGDQAVKVTGLMSGADALHIGDVTWNGKELDANTNDGHLMFEHGKSWTLQDGRSITENGRHFKFAEQVTTNEIDWSPVGDHAVRDRSVGISADLLNFLQAENIRFADRDEDGELSAAEWGRMIESIELHRGLLAAEEVNQLALILGMIDDFDQTLNQEEEGAEQNTTTTLKAAPTAAA